MASSQKTIWVYDHFSSELPTLLDRLYVNGIKGGELYSFEYQEKWLERTRLSLVLDPDLMPFGGRQYPNAGAIFRIYADASPDRWGRALLTKKERFLAGAEGRKPRKLTSSDFLLGVYDETRMGGIRFKLEPEGLLLSDDKTTAVPPWASLRTLEEAARQFENDASLQSEKWLEQLLRAGSSLGGPLLRVGEGRSGNGGRGNPRRRQGPLGKAGRPVPYPPGKGGRHAARVQCLLLKLRETFAVSGLQFGEAAADAALQPVHAAVIHQKHQGGDHPSHRVIQGHHFHGGPKGHRRQKP